MAFIPRAPPPAGFPHVMHALSCMQCNAVDFLALACRVLQARTHLVRALERGVFRVRVISKVLGGACSSNGRLAVCVCSAEANVKMDSCAFSCCKIQAAGWLGILDPAAFRWALTARPPSPAARSPTRTVSSHLRAGTAGDQRLPRFA